MPLLTLLLLTLRWIAGVPQLHNHLPPPICCPTAYASCYQPHHLGRNHDSYSPCGHGLGGNLTTDTNSSLRSLTSTLSLIITES